MLSKKLQIPAQPQSQHKTEPALQSIRLRDKKKANTTNTAYLEPNSSSMQKPIEGLPATAVFSTKKHRGKGAKENNRSLHTNSTYIKRGYTHPHSTFVNIPKLIPLTSTII